MSAFVVEDKIINTVVATLAGYRGYGEFPLLQTIAQEQGVDLRGPEGRRQLAEAMFALNVDAVHQRYGEEEARDFRFREEAPVGLIQAYKSLRCWLYQCAEGDVPEASLLYATMKKVSGDMAHEIATSLPAYQKAEW